MPGVLAPGPGGESVVSSAQPGRLVASRLPGVGESVRAGQVIGTVEGAVSGPEAASIRAEIARAEAELAQARADVVRLRAIARVVARKEIEAAEIRLRGAEAQRAALGGALGAGNRYAVVASVSGMVAEVTAAPGAYVDAGIAHLSPAPPRLVAVGGLSGSGKSSFSRLVAPGLGASPGAVVLRTDEVRKRLLNVPPTQAMSDRAYTPEFYNRAYDELIANARALLTAGRAVVLDATFIDPALRARAEQLARDCGVPFRGVWLDAPVEVLAGRVIGRTDDASDATVQTLRDQIGRHTSQVAWERIDASGPVEPSAADWAARQGA